MTPEQQRKYEEAIQRAMQHNPTALSPEQWQMVQAAMAQMQQTGAAQISYSVTQGPDGTVQQGTPFYGAPASSSDSMKAPPTTQLPSGWPQQAQSGSARPDPYVERMHEFARADLQRWLAQYQQYRMQGQFAGLEPVFEVIKRTIG